MPIRCYSDLNTLWAFATAKSKNEETFEAVARRASERDILMRMKPQDVSNILWAFATAKSKNEEAFEAVGRRASELDLL